jgi:DNA-binding MurR/RpiR family transcriptional regulator
VKRAVRTARRLRMTTIAMTGLRGRAFADECDIALITPHEATSHIQEGHIAMGHALCLIVERAMFERREGVSPAARAKPARRVVRRRAPRARRAARGARRARRRSGRR